MSEAIWVTTPGTVWVSEDHVMALASHLLVCEGTFISAHQSLSGIEVASRDPFTHALQHLPAQSLGPLAMAVATMAEEALSLREALTHYAHNSAEQERVRVQAWEVPRDRILALIAVMVGGRTPEIPFERWGVQEAAQALVGTPGPHRLEVTAVTGAKVGAVQRGTNIADRVGRIPDGENPIRIERYVSASGHTETDVYLAGTQEWSVGTSAEPFDMESNLALVAGVSAASMVAVEAAMRKAGVKPGDRVSFVGHSQGGLLAARLAESGRYATSSLLTVGAPLGTVTLNGKYPALAISHSDDLVPELAGASKPTGITHLETHSGAGTLDVAGAHAREQYVATAERVEVSPARDSLPHWEASGEAHPQFFQARRTDR